jgi:hypothetical protein
MCFHMVGCADRSPGQRGYRRARGFICIVPGDAARIARNRSASDWSNPAPDDIHLAVTIHCVDDEIIEWLECRCGGG